MVQEYPCILELTDGYVAELVNGLIMNTKKSSMWLLGKGVGWVQRDGPLSSEELFSARAVIMDYSSQPLTSPVVEKSCKSPKQDVLHWTKHQDKASW